MQKGAHTLRAEGPDLARRMDLVQWLADGSAPVINELVGRGLAVRAIRAPIWAPNAAGVPLGSTAGYGLG